MVAEPQTTQLEEQRQGPASQPSVSQFPLPVWIIEDPADVQRSRDRDAATDKREQKAVDIANESATAASQQAKWAFWQMVFSVVGFLALIATLFYTHRATRAAVRSVEITEQSQRPLLFAKIPGKFDVKQNGFSPYPPKFVLCNAGPSPAEVRGIYRKWTCGNGFPTPIRSGDRDEKFWKEEHIVVGAGQESEPRWSNDRVLDFTEAQNATHIFFYGYIEYADIGGNSWVSGYCLFRQADGTFTPIWPEKDLGKYKYIRRLARSTAGVPAPKLRRVCLLGRRPDRTDRCDKKISAAD